MDLDRDCLELMLNLLESDVSYQQALDVCGLSSQQLEKNKQKVRELCAEIQSQGHAMHLNLDAITVCVFTFNFTFDFNLLWLLGWPTGDGNVAVADVEEGGGVV